MATRTGFWLVIETDGYEWPSKEEDESEACMLSLLGREGYNRKVDLLDALEKACANHATVEVVQLQSHRSTGDAVETARWKIK